MSDLLDAALAYAARGWPVFPCWPGRKDPATAHGLLDAVTDPTRILAWWSARPDYNIGIATGAPGPDVADFDNDDETGLAALGTLTDAGLLEGCGSLIQTRSGGWHIYYEGTQQRNTTLRSKTGPSVSVDFRGAGGYVIAPPSYVEADDKPAGHYVLINPGAVQPAPIDWRIVRDLITPPDPFQQPAREHQALTGDRQLAGNDYAARTPWPDILTPRGWRQVRQIGGVRYWCRPGKAGRFVSASTRDDGGLWVFSTSTEFESERLYSKFGAYTLLAGFGQDYTTAAAQLRQEGYGERPPLLTLAPPLQQAGGDVSPGSEWWGEIAARHTPLDWQALFDDTPAEEDWIIEPLLAAGRSIALYSPAKAGKSLLMLEIAAALAAGRPVLGQPAGQLRRILYVDLENSRRDLLDRLTSLEYKPADLAGLVYLSFPSLPALDSAQGGREILGLAVAHSADVVIIDTVSRVISGKENDADTFADLYRHAMAPLKGLGIAVVRLDHAGKDIGKGQRGSSAKNTDVDAVWTLTAAGPIITLTCEMSRSQNEAQALRLKRMTGPLRHELTTPAEAATDRVQEILAKLDELGVPHDYGRDRCVAALNKASFPVGAKWAVEKAVAARKVLPDLPGDLEDETASRAGSPGSLDLPGMARAGPEETAGQTCPQDQRAGPGRSLQGGPVQPARPMPHTLVGGSGAGADAGHLCHSCGERHNPGPCYGKATA